MAVNKPKRLAVLLGGTLGRTAKPEGLSAVVSGRVKSAEEKANLSNTPKRAKRKIKAAALQAISK